MSRRQEIENIAKSILRDHGLLNTAVDPVRLAHAFGVKVFNAKFGQEGVHGLFARRGGEAQIYVHIDDPPFRKRFTIAHELGHYMLHLKEGDGEIIDDLDAFRTDVDPEAAWTDERRREWEANVFAAALLMDADVVRKKLQEIRDLEGLSRWFQVSEQAMAIRLNTLGLTV